MRLRSVQVPIARGLAICPSCGHPSDELPFASGGLGGNFRTWVHKETGAIYRQAIETSAATQAQEFKLICEHAGGEEKLEESPGTPLCKFCRVRFTPEKIDVTCDTPKDVFVVHSGSAA